MVARADFERGAIELETAGESMATDRAADRHRIDEQRNSSDAEPAPHSDL